MDKDIMRKEAVERLKNFAVVEEVVEAFEEGILMQSESNMGILFTLDEEAKKAVEEVEEMGFLPYHVIKTNTEFGLLYDVLFVSEEEEEWEYEKWNSTNKDLFAYCHNSSEPLFSEAGTILVTPANGGIKRIG